jgi:hypothetical protein
MRLAEKPNFDDFCSRLECHAMSKSFSTTENTAAFNLG